MDEQLRPAEFGFPRTDLRRRLVQAILSGEKTSTTGLLAEYQHEGPLPQVGERFLLIDELDRAAGVIETTEIRITTVGQVTCRSRLRRGRASHRSPNGELRTRTSSTPMPPKWLAGWATRTGT